jgi:Zn finger protein HypA/HybF involved in hydrogenase expression
MIDVRPPNLPWQELHINSEANGTLSFFYSDDLSKFPVRAVTKVGDNKADPNLETMTYGLFSTCQKDLRSATVKYGRRYIFFISRYKNTRVLVGYYAIKWYTSVVNASKNDFAIAANEAHFVSNPLPLDVVDKECGTRINRRFRLMSPLTGQECSILKDFLLRSNNATVEYLNEIHRLERFNKAQGRHLYIGRKLNIEYSWDVAAPYILSNKDSENGNKQLRNSSPSDWWTCKNCGHNLRNKALLRICPSCRAINTLTPLDNIPD